MADIGTNEFRSGVKIELDGQPYIIVTNEFVKPGKGQSFSRVKLKQILTGKVIERTFKSNEKFPIADVFETTKRLLYREGEDAVFMDDETFEQVSVPKVALGNNAQWLMENEVYGILFYKGNPVSIEPPIFMELKIIKTDPGERGDTSGRVLKPAETETGAQIQVPIFIQEGETVKIDTRTGEYGSRA